MWGNHGNVCVCGGTCSWFIHRYYDKGRAGQEKTDLEVRNTDWQREEASVIQLESIFDQMTQRCLSVCIRAAEELSLCL